MFLFGIQLSMISSPSFLHGCIKAFIQFYPTNPDLAEASAEVTASEAPEQVVEVEDAEHPNPPTEIDLEDQSNMKQIMGIYQHAES